MVRQRVRIRFAKQGDLRLIGHRDLVRLLERLFRRAGVPLATSQGFHPKPRMSFPSALALGIEGLDEVMELELAQPLDPEELLARLRHRAPAGIRFRSLQVLAPGTRKARVRSVTYELSIPAEHRGEVAQCVARLNAAGRCAAPPNAQQGGGDLRASLEELRFQDGVLRMRLRFGPGQTVSLRDVLAAMGLSSLEHKAAPVRRTQVELQP